MPNPQHRLSRSTVRRLRLAGFATTGVLLSVSGLPFLTPAAHAAQASDVTDPRPAPKIIEEVVDEPVDPTGTPYRPPLVDRGPGGVLEVNDLVDRPANTLARSAPRRAIQVDAQTLSKAMGGSVSLARYKELVPAFNKALAAANLDTVRRVAMFCAQVGHESDGLKYMEEIASGSEYNGRVDLGNTRPGDGERFKGRGPIQVTGRTNYRLVSAWAHRRGTVPTRDYFVDHPSRMASDRHGFQGVVWYWTSAQDMNDYADRKDIVGASKAVNGGTNGLGDRIDRWRHCLKMGDALLGK